MPVVHVVAFAMPACGCFVWSAANAKTMQSIGRFDHGRVLARYTWPVVARRCVEIYRSCQ